MKSVLKRVGVGLCFFLCVSISEAAEGGENEKQLTPNVCLFDKLPVDLLGLINRLLENTRNTGSLACTNRRNAEFSRREATKRDIFSKLAQERKPPVELSTGAVFKRMVYFEAKNPGKGKMWSDPNGVAWLDFARNPDRTITQMAVDDAEVYCHRLGLRLPTMKEVFGLRRFMGAIDDREQPVLREDPPYLPGDNLYEEYGYEPQLFGGFNGNFWINQKYNTKNNLVMNFNDGYIYYSKRTESQAVICVKNLPRKGGWLDWLYEIE